MTAEVVRDSQMRRDAALYLGRCHAEGWRSCDEGLEAFCHQMEYGFRDLDGMIMWEDYATNGVDKSLQRI